jgi:hypothetical protein
MTDEQALIEELRSLAETNQFYGNRIRNASCEAADYIEAQAAEIERLREIVYRYVDPFDVTPEDEAFVRSVIDAALKESK